MVKFLKLVEQTKSPGLRLRPQGRDIIKLNSTFQILSSLNHNH